MLKSLARFWAKLNYVWTLEVESAKSDINAAVATRNAADKRKLATQINAEADGIEKRITDLSEMEEKGYWLCENGHEANELKPSPDPKLPECPACGKSTKFIKLALMSGKEKYESEQERKDAEKLIAEKRNLAKQEEENAANAEQTATTLQGMAKNSRAFADKIRAI